MSTFFYPTQAEQGAEWLGIMLAEWRDSGKPYLCFPFMTFKPRTLPSNGTFWMYMYYRMAQTDIDALKGKVKFRVHVVKQSDSPVVMPTVHLHSFGGGETVWFLCDRAEEIRTLGGALLTMNDFKHRDEKVLYSAIRTSIAPVTVEDAKIQIVSTYP